MSEDSRGKHDDGKLLYCSFCGKSQHEVRKLIAGPSVFVCDELGLIINEIIRRENIVLDPQRANARLDELVGAYGDSEALKRAYQQNADAMRQVESLALEDQVVDWILDHAKVHAKVSTFKELMNFEG